MNRTKKACIKCGKPFYGDPDKLYCDDCAKDIKSNVMRKRTCKLCGAEFLGGPRAFYCPECRKIRQKKQGKEQEKGVEQLDQSEASTSVNCAELNILSIPVDKNTVPINASMRQY